MIGPRDRHPDRAGGPRVGRGRAGHPGDRRDRGRRRALPGADGRGRRLGRSRPGDVRPLGHDRRHRRGRGGRASPASRSRSSSRGCSRGPSPRSARRRDGSPTATTPPGSRATGPRRSPASPNRSTRWPPASNARRRCDYYFIANAAHELRTPQTNLQGYPEALRDGVIVADRATYDSLWHEAERSSGCRIQILDALTEGDTTTSPPHVQELDLAAAIRSALELAAQTTLERAGLRLVVEVPDVVRARVPPTTSHRSWPTCCRTPRATRRRASSPVTTRHRIPSIASTGRGHPARCSRPRLQRLDRVEKSPTGRGAARGSGWPSSNSSSSRAADGSAPQSRGGRGQLASGSACRVEPSSGPPLFGSSGVPVPQFRTGRPSEDAARPSVGM